MSKYRSGYPQNGSQVTSKYSDYKKHDYIGVRDSLLVQVSGPGRHDKRDPSSIARACFESPGLVDQNAQLRLILGIKANGASEFLAPAHLTTRLLYDVKRLDSATDPNVKFRSLSPITFLNIGALKDALGDHMNGKNGRPSKANKAYELSVMDSSSSTLLRNSRCQYEYARTLFRHMATTLPYSGVLYGISDPPVDQGILSEFLLFTCNDYKVGSERGFLDAAWGFVDYSTLKEKAEEAYRIKPHVEQDIDFLNEMFAEGRMRQESMSAQTMAIGIPEDDRITLREHLRTCFRRSSRPICFVVHDWPRAKDLLQEMHVDTSTWHQDLQSVLQGTFFKSESGGNQEDRKPYRNRSRSRSPPRRVQVDRSNPVKLEREAGVKRDPSPLRSSRPQELQVYVIDTKALYSTVRRSGNLSEDLVDACRDFDLPEVDEVPQKQFCAGNEIRYLWALLIRMVDGPTIDEMYRTQFKDKNSGRRMGDEDDQEEEEERAPSNTGFVAPRMAPATSKWKDPYDLQNDEFDDDSE